MQQIKYPIFERIGKMLHDQLDDVAREPLPERWTDLISCLGDQQCGQCRDSRPAQPTAPKPNPLGTRRLSTRM